MILHRTISVFLHMIRDLVSGNGNSHKNFRNTFGKPEKGEIGPTTILLPCSHREFLTFILFIYSLYNTNLIYKNINKFYIKQNNIFQTKNVKHEHYTIILYKHVFEFRFDKIFLTFFKDKINIGFIFYVHKFYYDSLVLERQVNFYIKVITYW